MTVGLFLFIPIQSIATLSCVAIVFGLYLFVRGFGLLARQRSLLTMPTPKIHSAARGLVEVNGFATGPCTTLAPITEEPCFLYHTTAWQQRKGKKNEWEKVADESLHLPFFIYDSTGQLLIEALGADLELNPLFRGEYAPTLLDLNDIPLAVIGFLSRHGIALDRDLRIEERLIKTNDALFVAATLMENPKVQARPISPRSDVGADRRNPGRDPVRDTVRDNVRDTVRDNVSDTVRNAAPTANRRSPERNHSSEPFPAPEVIRLASAAASSTREMTQQAKIAAALTRVSGNPQAWSPAELRDPVVNVEENAPPATVIAHPEVSSREARLQEASPDEARLNEARLNEDRAESSDVDLAPPVVLMKGKDDPTFVISFRSQKEIVSATTWKAGVIVCVGTAITLLGFYVLCAQMALL